jgi:hypothetical protein
MYAEWVQRIIGEAKLNFTNELLKDADDKDDDRH